MPPVLKATFNSPALLGLKGRRDMFQLGYLLPGFRFRARILPETYSSGGAKCNAAIIRVNGKRHLNQHILVFWSYVCHSISKYPFFISTKGSWTYPYFSCSAKLWLISYTIPLVHTKNASQLIGLLVIDVSLSGHKDT